MYVHCQPAQWDECRVVTDRKSFRVVGAGAISLDGYSERCAFILERMGNEWGNEPNPSPFGPSFSHVNINVERFQVGQTACAVCHPFHLGPFKGWRQLSCSRTEQRTV